MERKHKLTITRKARRNITQLSQKLRIIENNINNFTTTQLIIEKWTDSHEKANVFMKFIKDVKPEIELKGNILQ